MHLLQAKAVHIKKCAKDSNLSSVERINLVEARERQTEENKKKGIIHTRFANLVNTRYLMSENAAHAVVSGWQSQGYLQEDQEIKQYQKSGFF